MKEGVIEGDRVGFAIGLRLLSAGVFACMNATMKLAEAQGAGIGEIMFFRQSVAAVFIAGVIAAGPGLRSAHTQRLSLHVTRTAIGLVAMVLSFSAVLALPLAEATTINFTVPIFATILGALILHEPTGWRRWSAVVIGFAGVLIVAQPTGGNLPLRGALCGLAGAFGTATISILLRQMGKTEGALTTVLWFSVLSVPPLAIVYGFVAAHHSWLAWVLLVAVGLFGGTAQVAMTASLRLAPVSVVVPMDYSALLWAGLLGFIFFGNVPAEATWIGAPLIIGSGLMIVWREHVRRQRATRQAVG